MEFRLARQKPGVRSKQALEYWRDWCDYPERPMLTLGLYQSGVFVHYVTRRWGEQLAANVWNSPTFDSMARETDGDPFDIIRKLTDQGRLMLDYATHAYFFGDPESYCYAPCAARRYLSRALAKSVVMEASVSGVTVSGTVSESGIRYYALRVGTRHSVTAAFRPRNSANKSECLASIVAASHALCRVGDQIELDSVARRVAIPPGTDHLVVAVTVEPQVREQWVDLESHEFELVIE
jgi:hypothetical protein